jgi:hypothetical protein
VRDALDISARGLQLKAFRGPPYLWQCIRAWTRVLSASFTYQKTYKGVLGSARYYMPHLSNNLMPERDTVAAPVRPGSVVSDQRFLFHCEPRLGLCRTVSDAIEDIDPHAPIKRSWDSAIGYMEGGAMNSVDVLIDVLGANGMAGLEHLQDLWRLRVLYNHSAIPLYFALSCTEQPASLRYEIRRLGGRFMHVSDVARHFVPQMDEVRLELDEVQRSVPRWEIIEEYSGSDPVRAYIFLRFSGKLIPVGGSDRHLAVLAVFLKNNGIPRSMKALRQLCSEYPLFDSAGGPFSVPRLATLKMHIFRDFPKYLQKAFDDARAGYYAGRIIEHVDLGAKAMGFRIRGLSSVSVR